MGDLLIRELRMEDAEQVSRIHRSITKKSDIFDMSQIVNDQMSSGIVISLAAERDGQIVGYMVSYVLSGGFGIDKGAWIAVLGVDTRFMGQGIGKRIAEELFKIYKEQGITNIFTSVRWDSTDVLSFFKTLGFDRSSFINLHKVVD